MKYIILYVILINIISGVLTVYDKIAAKKNNYRISELTLILSAILGGAITEFVVMLIIRHKTKRLKFMLSLPVIITVHLLLLIILLWSMNYAKFYC